MLASDETPFQHGEIWTRCLSKLYPLSPYGHILRELKKSQFWIFCCISCATSYHTGFWHFQKIMKKFARSRFYTCSWPAGLMNPENVRDAVHVAVVRYYIHVLYAAAVARVPVLMYSLVVRQDTFVSQQRRQRWIWGKFSEIWQKPSRISRQITQNSHANQTYFFKSV